MLERGNKESMFSSSEMLTQDRCGQVAPKVDNGYVSVEGVWIKRGMPKDPAYLRTVHRYT